MMIQQAQMKTEKYSQDMKLQKEEFVGNGAYIVIRL